MGKIRPALLTSIGALLVACTGGGGGTPSPSAAAKVSPPPDTALVSAGTLTIGSDVSYPPQEFREGTNELEGFDIDIGKALADRMGLKVVFVHQPFEGIIAALVARKYDVVISAMTINDDRKQKLDFVPYFRAGEAFVVARGASAKPARLDDLCGVKVAVQKGAAQKDELDALNDKTRQGKCADRPVQLQTFETSAEAVAQLTKGAVDVWFADSPIAGYTVKTQQGLQLSGGILEAAPQGIAVRKADRAVLDAVAAAFSAVRADGTYRRLLEKWGLLEGTIDA